MDDKPWLGDLVKDTLKRMQLNEIQEQIDRWRGYNFPKATPDQQFMGMTEELGELAHAILKGQQGIRGYSPEDTAEIKDAIGDLMIYLLNFCSMHEWSALEILQDVWDEVKERDWQANPEDGVVTVVVEE